MTNPGTAVKPFESSAGLQKYLLSQPPGVLIIVPHMRLAHQVWRRQRLEAQAAGISAWEPLAMTTLSGWWHQLLGQLWLPLRPASSLERLVHWKSAMAATPSPPKVTPDLAWAAALDEALELSQRYQIPPPQDLAAESPLIIWRQEVGRTFIDLLTQQGLVIPARIPSLLLQALAEEKLGLPDRIVVVGLETPAPMEDQWLRAVGRRRPIVQVRLLGRGATTGDIRAVSLPDMHQEMEWVAAQVFELAAEKGIPLHRLAITAPNLEAYLPGLRRIFKELLGQAADSRGGSYNFSLGPTLAETPLWQAALLPVRFILGGEQRQDLISWLLSPYYGALKREEKTSLRWDMAWRQAGAAYGWQSLRSVLATGDMPERDGVVVTLLQQALSLLPAKPLPAALWQDRLQEIWRFLEFPHHLGPPEARQWRQLLDLLQEVAAVGGQNPWTMGDLVEWLTWTANRLDLPGDGSFEAGIQIQGLLELRGLDFDAVFCMGLNMGVFPPPPRSLPLLTPQERKFVLGGDYESQREFAHIAYASLTAAAPRLILTRPQVWQEEDQMASSIIPPCWEEEPVKFAPLSHPHPAWLRSPAIRAALHPFPSDWEQAAEALIPLPLPLHLPLAALSVALSCPCRFYLEVLLGLQPLPEIVAGLPPLARGNALHQVLADFTSRFGDFLEHQSWDDEVARQYLREAVDSFISVNQTDPHWEAERARWLEDNGGVLQEWLRQERERHQVGWRWLHRESPFQGLQLNGWPTALRGRLDRIDGHDTFGLMVWDYKSGSAPKLKDIRGERGQFQLIGYILAVEQHLIPVQPRQEVRAGIIGLQSGRADHLKFEDFGLSASDWQSLKESRLAEVARIGARVQQGDFRPDPSLAPPQTANSCTYCPFILLCGYRPATGRGEAE